MKFSVFFFALVVYTSIIDAKEVALTFDDAPIGSTYHFNSEARTKELIRKLKSVNAPPAMIFANPCKGTSTTKTLKQLKAYTDNGHFIGNHTCTHPRLDDVGFKIYSEDTERADKLLAPFFKDQKFFRFPFLNESKDEKLRDQMREWLARNNYRNGMVSIDNDDYHFSYKINLAKELGKKIDHKKVKALFLDHLMGAAEYYEDLAIKTIGYSPKHVMLLHEMDVTVMYIDDLITELRARGWKIISIDEAFKDKLYLENPKNTYANNGIISQLAFEKTGQKIGYFKFEEIKAELNKILDLHFNKVTSYTKKR